MSNHAVGLGVDFDWEANPWIMNRIPEDKIKKKPEVIEKHFLVLDKLLSIRLWSSKSYKDSLACNVEFRTRFLGEWEYQKMQIEAGLWGLFTQAEWCSIQELAATHYAGGFLTIPFAVVRELVNVQKLGWGGYYDNSRDFMHFEYPTVAGGLPPDDEFL